MVRLHEHQAVVAGEVAKAARFQYAIDLVKQGLRVGDMFIDMGADHHIKALVGVCQVHGVAPGVFEVGLLELLTSEDHGRFVDIDTGDVAEVARQVVVDDAAGAANIEQRQV